jgi:hypothetical protein
MFSYQLPPLRLKLSMKPLNNATPFDSWRNGQFDAGMCRRLHP